ncbi:MAG: deoxyribonuclease V [Thermonemataceae bacterium]
MQEQDYIAIQQELSTKVVQEDQLLEVHYVAGVDVAYEKAGAQVVAAITLLDAHTLQLLETAIHAEKASFPYIPGLFSFREIPPILKAWQKLTIQPDLVICDGQGYAHPRRFGLACHLGVELDIPAIGCAKSRLIGQYDPVAVQRGSASNLIDNQEVIGKVLRTQQDIKPVFVSIGHKVSLATACDWVLKLSPQYRLPETTRTADQAVKIAMKALNEDE